MATKTDTTTDSKAPTTARLADRLDVEPDLLVRFVEYHPDPTAPAVLGWATADPRHRDAVEAWLAAHRRRERERRDEADLSNASIPLELRGRA